MERLEGVNPSISALLLAGLLTMPLVAEWLTRVKGELNAPRPRILAAFHAAYVIATVVVSAWLIRELAAPIDSNHGRVALTMMAGATLCLLAAPLYPLAVPIVYVVLHIRSHATCNDQHADGGWRDVMDCGA